jgi:hypothetical protein
LRSSVGTRSLAAGFATRCFSGATAAEGTDCAAGGEAGSGGGSAARAIGWSSARAEKPEIGKNNKENIDNHRAL